MTMETHILAVAQQFAREVIELENLKAGSDATIELIIKGPPKYGDERKPKITLECRFWDGSAFTTVIAASLGALMDEVHRRCGFADKQITANEANERALVALEAPKSFDEDGMYHPIDKTDKWDEEHPPGWRSVKS